MKFHLIASLALASLTTSSLTIAADSSARLLADYHAPLAAAAMSAKAAGSTTTPGTPMANTYRAYPPSCAAYPLPDKASGPSYTGITSALANPVITASGTYFSATEALTVTVWRLPCSSSGAGVPYNTAGAKNAMTLVRIDRTDDTVIATLPMMPLLLASQGSIDFTSAKSYVRLASEPNTVLSDRRYGNMYDLFKTSTTYVLENFSNTTAGQFNFNAAFTLRVDGGVGSPTDIAVPAYAPAADTYPDASNPISLDGYAAAQYINSERGEGLIVQVAEGYDSANPKRRQVVFDLLTKDGANKPFWIVGAAAFDPIVGGVRGLDIPVTYLVENNATQAWGTVHVAMTSCNLMTVTFTPNADLPQGVPSISGPIAYTRLLGANGMICE
jgi:hypothetical protein